MSTLGLIIGRFQPLHLGHLLLIETSLKEHPATLILVGSVNKQDVLNPYSYELRKHMLQTEIATLRSSNKVRIGGLPDFASDQEWKDAILGYIPDNVHQVTLYCGDMENDSALISLSNFEDSLPFKLILREIPRSIIPVSATQVRAWITQSDTQNLQKYMGEKTLLLLGLKL